ncbi:hypothetical protein [Chryseobacterium daecheongense]|uniref:Uncharacterized protein n=1 Tax=Chryseobacterium daecheongense TaxID=192389 RepID=A0A3N0W5Z3_9FLAO|nr:hypothetical protein [Chryseobacterium daecheongense]ROI00433.1 hypothetical protein EGI05_05990 [Chryseobacterium daecheongense]TDX94599.1 hypothetical protein BCF50_0367 [Chryseobacterium daecheongense]
MRQLKNLRITKSIESKKLIYEEDWFDKFDTFTNYLMFLGLIFFSTLLLYDIKPSANSNLEYMISISVLMVGLYGFYCKFTEKNLKEIKFDIHKEDAKQRILEYGRKNNYRVSKISNNLIFLNEPSDTLSFKDCEKTTIIFFKEQSILYTLINEGSRTNRPVLISQHITRIDLKKILSLKKPNTQKLKEV